MNPTSFKKLYHYTTLQGAYGILESQALWATHCKFLNDYSELLLFKQKLVEHLTPFAIIHIRDLFGQHKGLDAIVEEMGGLNKAALQETTNLVDACYDALKDEIYITSFCGEHDREYTRNNGLLSQWRGYGGSGGVALVFNSEKLAELLDFEIRDFEYGPKTFANAVYSGDPQKFINEFSDHFGSFAVYIKEYFQKASMGSVQAPDATEFLPSFFECITRYKHHGFMEESEVRIAVAPAICDEALASLACSSSASLKPEKIRFFRDKNGEKVPYISLFGKKGRPLPIEQIIVGPHKEKEARADALKILLRDTDILVSVSDIPYVG